MPAGMEYRDPEAAALYRTWRTEELIRLRAAFLRDKRKRGVSLETIEFAAGRIEIIDRILKEREQCP